MAAKRLILKLRVKSEYLNIKFNGCYQVVRRLESIQIWVMPKFYAQSSNLCWFIPVKIIMITDNEKPTIAIDKKKH